VQFDLLGDNIRSAYQVQKSFTQLPTPAPLFYYMKVGLENCTWKDRFVKRRKINPMPFGLNIGISFFGMMPGRNYAEFWNLLNSFLQANY
jgi:hypothetical protein